MPKRRLPRWKKLVFSAGVGAFAFVVLLLGLEGALALADSGYPRNGLHDGVLYTWGHEVRWNSLGFRDDEPATPRRPDVTRIVFVGDSITFGVGVAKDARVTEVLERRLHAHHPERRFEVLNLGRSGAGTVEMLEILEEHLDALAPDLIVLGACVNDPLPRARAERGLDGTRWVFGTLDQLERVGLRRSRRFLIHRTRALLQNLDVVPDLEELLDEAYAESSADWQTTRTALTGLAELAREHHLPPPTFVLLAETRGDFANRYGQLGEAARSAGLTVLDLQAAVEALPAGTPTTVNDRDLHPSPELHRVYGTAIAEALDP